MRARPGRGAARAAGHGRIDHSDATLDKLLCHLAGPGTCLALVLAYDLQGTLQTAVAVAKAFGTSFEGLVRAFLIIVNGLASAFRALAPA